MTEHWNIWRGCEVSFSGHTKTHVDAFLGDLLQGTALAKKWTGGGISRYTCVQLNLFFPGSCCVGLWRKVSSPWNTGKGQVYFTMHIWIFSISYSNKASIGSSLCTLTKRCTVWTTLGSNKGNVCSFSCSRPWPLPFNPLEFLNSFNSFHHFHGLYHLRLTFTYI